MLLHAIQRAHENYQITIVMTLLHGNDIKIPDLMLFFSADILY